MFAPLLVPPPPSVFHAPFSTLLCFQRMTNRGPRIRASRIVTILDISIRMLMCPKADKGASSRHLTASPFVIVGCWLSVKGVNPRVEGFSWVFMHYYQDEMTRQHFTCHGYYYG